MLATANHDFSQIVLAGVAQDGFIFLRVGKSGGFGTQLLRQAKRTQYRAALVLGQCVQLRRFDIYRMPDAAKFGRQARGGADKLFIAAAVAYAQQDGISRMPDALLALQVAPGAHLIVDAIGSTTQGQLAQGNQVAFTEEMFDGALGLAGNINLAFVQALAQIVRGQVNQHHFIGGIKEGVGHRLAHLNAGHAADHVVQAFEMLNVNRREYIDAGFEQLFYILPALWVA